MLLYSAVMIVLLFKEALMEVNRQLSAAVAKDAADSSSTDTRTGKTVTVDQIESHIKHFR